MVPSSSSMALNYGLKNPEPPQPLSFKLSAQCGLSSLTRTFFVFSPYVRNALSASPDTKHACIQHAEFDRDEERKSFRGFSAHMTFASRWFVLYQTWRWRRRRRQQHLSGGCSALRAHLVLWATIRLMTLTAPRRPSPLVSSSLFRLLCAPSSQSRTAVKAITMKSASACVYGALQRSSAESRTRGIKGRPGTSPFTRFCNLARLFIFTASLGAFVDLNFNGGASLLPLWQSGCDKSLSKISSVRSQIRHRIIHSSQCRALQDCAKLATRHQLLVNETEKIWRPSVATFL